MRKPSIKANPEGPYELLNDAKAKPGYDRDALEKSALGYRPPAPETIIPLDQRPIMH